MRLSSSFQQHSSKDHAQLGFGAALIPSLLLLLLSGNKVEATSHPIHGRLVQPRSLPYTLNARAADTRPIKIKNQCAETVHPAILTQSGGGPSTSGFELPAGKCKTLDVGPDWQGRVWGRTNCTFNSAGTGGVDGGFDGSGKACLTGDCAGGLECTASGQTPVTLAEFTLSSASGQAFYDISLVDGYNLPLAIVLLAGGNDTFNDIPPNLTNPSCVGTGALLADQGYDPYNGTSPEFLGTNSSYPLPFDESETMKSLSRWCPWSLQLQPPTKPGDGVYPYPDDEIPRPDFDPCYSACAKNNQPSDCCTEAYNTPMTCKPGLYSMNAKAACPDAYSYAYDDMTSTFIVPSGSGFEVVFCPGGRSTSIFRSMSTMVQQLSTTGRVDPQIMQEVMREQVVKKSDAALLGTAWTSEKTWLVTLTVLLTFAWSDLLPLQRTLQGALGNKAVE
ncbi:MAG: hypothetical protein M1837_005369 [Sclerophora amabilis]|nr:MAG: hypothetical protein M1837_005369 [Sclerophora amabilis]